MTKRRVRFSTTCRQCGHELPPETETCPGCGKAVAAAIVLSPWAQWSKESKTRKTLWTASVITFWVSAIILGFLYVIQNKLSLVVLSIVVGMLILGVWLKARYQIHLRKEPDRPTQDVRAD